jgi:hypothetical protein
VRDDGPGAANVAEELAVDRVDEGLVRQIDERAEGRGPGVVDQDVDFSAAVSFSFASVRAQMATPAPSSASFRAIAMPMPSLAPVTSAVLPPSPNTIVALLLPDHPDQAGLRDLAVSSQERQIEVARRRADQRVEGIPIRPRRVGLIDLLGREVDWLIRGIRNRSAKNRGSDRRRSTRPVQARSPHSQMTAAGT